MVIFSRLNAEFGRRALAVFLGLAVSAGVLVPSPAEAWWVGRRGVWVAPLVVVGPPVVYAARPHRVWIPAHWRGPSWVPGHWGW